MERVYRWTIHHRKMIMIIFVAAAIFCLLQKPLVGVDYDINDYLPEESSSTIALNTLNDEYEGGIPNARVMIRNVSIPDALEYKEKLKELDGVTDVTWLDDAAEVTQPLETIDQEELDTYYLNGNALFSVTIDEEKRVEATEEIRALIGDDNAMTGSAISTAIATTSTVSEVNLITVIAVVFVFMILALTTNSWFKPVIVMASLGVAIVINMGSNIIFGTISFVSNAAGNVLQLAVSLDYSVFLMHRYEECRKQTENKEDAMVDALMKSTMSILSSGLTTVIGFLALCLMQFLIGPDLGLVLAKGVAISLLTVFFFSSALIVTFETFITKFEHRELMPKFTVLGKLVTHQMIPAAVVLLAVMVPAYLASGSNSYYYGASHIFGLNTQLGRDTAEIEEIFGKKDTYVLMVPKGDFVTEKELSKELDAMPEVTSILSYVDNAGETIPMEYLEKDTLSKLVSEHYSRLVITVKADYEGDATFALVARIRAMAEKYYPGTWLLAGEGVSTTDLCDTITDDTVKVNAVSIGAVFLVLLISFKSLSLPVILVLAIETAFWINMSICYFAGDKVFYIAYLIISSIQLGATVDYAILLTDTYTEHRHTMKIRPAVALTISEVTVSILTSGIVMTFVGFLMGYISTHGLISQLGFFLGKGTLCSMVIVLFALPGMLCLLDWLVRHTTKNANFYTGKKENVQ